MSEDIEKLIKIQGILNKDLYHLCIDTNLKDYAEWRLYQAFMPADDYLSRYNHAILYSGSDTVADLDRYLQKHNGYKVVK